MSRRNGRKVKPSRYSREGVDTFSEVSAFLGGIFFTGLLILVQQREKFDVTVLETNLQHFTIRISQLHLVAIPLSISVILFIFSSIFFAIACSQVDQSNLEKMADDAFMPFILGLFSIFVSLLVVLALIDVFVSMLGFALSLGTLLWWLRKRS